jgi:hypothetical protein
LRPRRGFWITGSSDKLFVIFSDNVASFADERVVGPLLIVCKVDVFVDLVFVVFFKILTAGDKRFEALKLNLLRLLLSNEALDDFRDWFKLLTLFFSSKWVFLNVFLACFFLAPIGLPLTRFTLEISKWWSWIPPTKLTDCLLCRLSNPVTVFEFDSLFELFSSFLSSSSSNSVILNLILFSNRLLISRINENCSSNSVSFKWDRAVASYFIGFHAMLYFSVTLKLLVLLSLLGFEIALTVSVSVSLVASMS